MTEPSRLLRREEIAAIAGRLEGVTPGPWTTTGTHRNHETSIDAREGDPRTIGTGGWYSFVTCWGREGGADQAAMGETNANANAAFVANARQDVPALLAHVALLESMIGDMAADEGRGLVLRMRRALQDIAGRARACANLRKPTQLQSALMDTAHRADVALRTD